MIIYTESYCVIAQEGQEPEQGPGLCCGSREKRDRMKKIFVYIIMSSLIVGLLSGCGGEYGTASKGTSGSAVSGAVVSGQAVEARQMVSHQYATDTNLYRTEGEETADDYFILLIQSRLDRSHEKKIKIKNFESIIGIKDAYLYYHVEDYSEKGEYYSGCICRVPIKKDAGGYDVIDTEHAEILMELDWIADSICMVSHYIYANPQKSGKIVKYDIQSRKEVPVEELEISSDNPGIVFMDCGSQAAALCTKMGLFVQNVEETGWKLVSDNKDLAWSWMAWDDNALFYTTEDAEQKYEENVWKIDLGTRREERFASKEQLWRAAAAALDIEESRVELCAVTRLFCDRGRCYVQVQVNWLEDEIYHMEYLVFSQGQEETGLCFEKALTECMRTYGTTREGKWMNYYRQNKVIMEKWVEKEHVLLRDAKCYCIKNGKAFLCLYDYKKDRERVGYYELESGQFHWLSKKDAEYYEPCYDEPQGDEGPFLDDYYEAGHRFTGIDWSPNVDAPLEGPEGGFEEG